MTATITLLDAVATSLEWSKPADWCSPEHWHEAANIFPLMPDDELQKLASDIKQHGQRNPIILLNNKVLDGRNRVLACKLAGVRPEFQTRNPDKLGSPTSWVLSQNLHRRQLTATQRAFIAVEAEKLFAKEIAEKEHLRKTQSTEQKVAQSPDGEERAPQARDKAAEACDVNRQYISDAKKISAMSPDTAEAAKAGGISMAEARRAIHGEATGGKFQKLTSPVSEPTSEPEDPQIFSATIKDYYASSLGDSHPHGKDIGALNGRGIVYVAKCGIREPVGWLVLRQNSDSQCIVRLLAKEWNLTIGNALLAHALAHHTNLYALLDDLDSAEYLELYKGFMHEVSRQEKPTPELFNDLPADFDWTKQACTDYLAEHPEMHQRLIDNSQALKIRINSGGDFYSPEEVKQKLQDISCAGKQFWLLRPRTVMRYEPAPPQEIVDGLEKAPETPQASNLGSRTEQLREFFSRCYPPAGFKIRTSDQDVRGVGGRMGRCDLILFNLTPKQIHSIGEVLATDGHE